VTVKAVYDTPDKKNSLFLGESRWQDFRNLFSGVELLGSVTLS